MTSLTTYLLAGSRDCPVCGGCGTRDVLVYGVGGTCRSCGASGFIPYPWALPEDGSVYPMQPWSREEDAIVTAAPSVYLAYAGYCAIYGPVRSYRSVKDHRRLRQMRPDWLPRWTEADETLIESAPDIPTARARFREAHPLSTISDNAIGVKWSRLHRK